GGGAVDGAVPARRLLRRSVRIDPAGCGRTGNGRARCGQRQVGPQYATAGACDPGTEVGHAPGHDEPEFHDPDRPVVDGWVPMSAPQERGAEPQVVASFLVQCNRFG